MELLGHGKRKSSNVKSIYFSSFVTHVDKKKKKTLGVRGEVRQMWDFLLDRGALVAKFADGSGAIGTNMCAVCTYCIFWCIFIKINVCVCIVHCESQSLTLFYYKSTILKEYKVLANSTKNSRVNELFFK